MENGKPPEWAMTEAFGLEFAKTQIDFFPKV